VERQLSVLIVAVLIVAFQLALIGDLWLQRAGRRRAERALRVSEARRHDLAMRLIASQELERQRIARELHDDLSQKVALLAISLDLAAAQVEQAATQEMRASLQRLARQTEEIAAEIHNLSYALHPSKLQILGLASAMRSLCRGLERQLDVRVDFVHDSLPDTIDPDVSLCLYRVAQEALRNVVRHSHAREAQVRLASNAECIFLYIADSGIGFDPRVAERAGLGLVSMRERVDLLSGQLAVHASPGGGTRIGVRMPLASPMRDERAGLLAAESA
jgi:signal transduction histidine kinase